MEAVNDWAARGFCWRMNSNGSSVRELKMQTITRRSVLLALGLAHAGRGMAAPSRSVTRSRTTEIGIASWYGHPYHGRRAADGEIYDMEKLTAAHRTLRFNTRVRVVN